MALERKGDFDAAIRKYQQFFQERPMSPDAYAGLTRIYLKKKDVTQAYATVTKGLQVSNGWPIRVALGEVYFRQGKISEAEKEWVDVINSGHQAARAYLGLARVRSTIAMNKSAKTMIDRAHEIDPDDPDIQRHWIATLPRSERIKYFESYLAGSNNSDMDERSNLAIYLSYLKEQAKQHDRPCRLVSKVKNTETPLVRLLTDPQHLRGYGLSVGLNGTHTNIMLDTGASGIVVKRHTAEKAGITKLTETKIWGVGDKGKRDAYVGTAKSIRIGELEFQDCPVEVVESRSVAEEDGLIGADVFEDFLVEIDFPGEKLKLSELPKRPGQGDQQLALKNDEDDSDEQQKSGKAESTPQTGAREPAPTVSSSGPQDRYIAPEMQSFTPVFRFGHDLLVPTKIGDVPYKLFLLDTGALTNFISPEAAREVTKVHGDSDSIVKGISGSVKNVYRANKAVLQFGRLRQENQDMLSFDTSSVSESNGTEVSGFLGFVTLRFLDIKIDYRDALVDFSYDARHFGR
jgi:tetratricopeptide (TPR) repeat protein